MAKTYYTKERLVAARPRSPRLRRLGASVVNMTASAYSSSSPSGVSSSSSQTNQSSVMMSPKHASSGAPAVVLPTSQGNPTPDVGQCYFDKKLGLPLWWDGSDWVDSTGARLRSCVIDGVESSVLEGSSLVVEVPDETTVTVTMGGEDITEEVLDDGVVTIHYVAGDIEIVYGNS